VSFVLSGCGYGSGCGGGCDSVEVWRLRNAGMCQCEERGVVVCLSCCLAMVMVVGVAEAEAAARLRDAGVWQCKECRCCCVSVVFVWLCLR